MRFNSLLSFAALDILRGVAVFKVDSESMQITDPLVHKSLMEPTAVFHRLVIDLQMVSRMDSLGFGALVQARLKCREKGGDLAVACAPDNIRNLLQLMRGESEGFEPFESVAAAMSDLCSLPKSSSDSTHESKFLPRVQS